MRGTELLYAVIVAALVLRELRAAALDVVCFVFLDADLQDAHGVHTMQLHL